MSTRKYSQEEKLKILQEASESGVKVTLEKYDIYPATYYYWKKKFKEQGEVGLKHGMNKAKAKEIRRLEKENQALRDLVVEKELAIKMLMELQKKRTP